ncbi:MAG: mechanosensitive ion channel domain-containing protein [Candidatus Bathyarchaeia archaeon]
MFPFSYSMLLEVAAVIGFALLVQYLLSWAFLSFGRRAGFSRAQLITIRKWIRLLTLVIAVAGIANVVGLGSQAELLTIGGIGALVFSMMIQGFVSNVFSGFLVFEQDTLRFGDSVEVAGAGKGRVVKVGLRNIWIKTETGALVVIENSRLEHGRLWNYSAVERLEKHFDSKSSIS